MMWARLISKKRWRRSSPTPQWAHSVVVADVRTIVDDLAAVDLENVGKRLLGWVEGKNHGRDRRRRRRRRRLWWRAPW